MIKVVGIRFREGGKVAEFDAGDLALSIGDPCIVQTDDGLRNGEVATNPKSLQPEYVSKELGRVMRKATVDDFSIIERNRELRRTAYAFAIRRINDLHLPMKLVEVEPYFDRSKVVFYFTAEGRVDFRQLVKDLAVEIKMRIKMKQIGVRDEAKMLGGFGTCGRQLCCVSFLKDFEPVSIRMAKEQELPLSPGKISGVCGRLMCCLVYEAETYRQMKRGLPRMGEKVRWEGAQGKVIRNNIFEEVIVIEREDGTDIQVAKSEWRAKNRDRGDRERDQKGRDGRSGGSREDRGGEPAGGADDAGKEGPKEGSGG